MWLFGVGRLAGVRQWGAAQSAFDATGVAGMAVLEVEMGVGATATQ